LVNKGYVLKISLSAEDFEILLSYITPKSFLLAQNIKDIKLTKPESSINMSDLLKEGRIFNPEFEIRYEKIDDGSYSLLIFAEDKSNIKKMGLSLEVCDDLYEVYEIPETQENIFLWGKKIKNRVFFVEVQIPKPLEYPEIDGLEDKDELVIKAKDYKKNEIPRFTRFIGVEKYGSGS